jgi:hypothetical protein
MNSVMWAWWFRLLWVPVALAAPGYPASSASLAWHHDAKLSHEIISADTPRWSGGALVSDEGILTASPLIRTFDREGRELLPPFAFTIPEARSIDVFSLARGLDGTIALCGVAFDSDGRYSSFLASVPPSHDNVQIVRASPFTPYRVAVASDGTVWAVGIELINGEEPEASRSAGVIRHFDKSGREVGSFIARSTIESASMVEQGYFAAGRDRIGWYPQGGKRYIEISQDGTITQFPALPLRTEEQVTGIALTDDAGTYVSTYDHEASSWRILTVNNAHSGWSHVEVPTNLRSILRTFLRGADGNNLVFSGQDKLTLTFHTATVIR